MKTTGADVVVIGGGIVGASCAYYLCQEGFKVHLVEKGSIASGASGACEGVILLWDKKPGPELRLGLLAARLHESLADELPADFHYTKKCNILVAENEKGLEAAQQKVQDLRHEGVECHLLDARELFEVEPGLARDLAGGAMFPQDALVYPISLTMGLAYMAQQMGATLHPFTTVQSIELSAQGAIRAVHTTEGRIATEITINAAGAWSPQIGNMVGVRIPVEPRKGHIIVTEPLPLNTVRNTLMEAGYVSTVESGEAELAVATVIESTHNGNILLGSSRERVGFDRTTSPRVIEAIAARALRFVPSLKGVSAIRTYAGLRPYSLDHLPIIGPVEEVPGFYVVTGHEGAGICLGPISGKLIAQLIVGREPDFPMMSALSPARFLT
jgi:glycine/D-amino acid oxidase-like deaminating enzyme